MNRLLRFPFKLYFEFLALILVVFNLIFWALLVFLRYQVGMQINFVVQLNLWYFFVSALASAGLAYRICRPIQRITMKALSISSKKAARDPSYALDEEDFFEDVTGDYAELEVALNRISRKMKNRKEQIQREREEMQAIMSAVEEGLVSIDADENFIYFNSQFAAQFMGSSKMLEGQVKLTEVIRAPEVNEAFREVLESGRMKKVMTWLATTADNQQRYFSISLAPLKKSESGQIYTVIGVFHDITEIKKAEQIRIEFVSNASHELRTPLTAVKGYVETLREDFASGQTEMAGAFLGTVSRNVDRLIELVNDLLSLSNLEGTPEVRLEPMNPLAVTENIVNELSKIMNDKSQRIVIKCDVKQFEADYRKVEQVLRNLIGNAVKYIQSGGVVQIVWSQDEAMNTYLRVIDNGPGIPEEHHARLFERFYRIDKGRSRDVGGTGLGLAIVKHIMQSHGGSIQVQSQIGKGAEFICFFPKPISRFVNR